MMTFLTKLGSGEIAVFTTLKCGLAVLLLSAVSNIARAQQDRGADDTIIVQQQDDDVIVVTQPPSDEIEALRVERLRAKDTFFDDGQSTAERIEAATRLGYPDRETFADLLRLGLDPNEDPAIRLVALRRYYYDQDYRDAVFTIIANPDEDETLAAGLIEDLSRRLTFRQPAEIRQQIQRAFRERLTDNRAAVRLAVYRALIASHDQMAVGLLVDSLRDGGDLPIPLLDALELLYLDGARKHIVTVRPYRNHEDPEVQAKAVQILAADPESRSFIPDVILDPDRALNVRINALRELAREDERFCEYAIEIMNNKQESPDLRYWAMHACVGRMNYHAVPVGTQIKYADAVRGLASERSVRTQSGRNVTAEAKRLIPYLQKRFPVIRKHYRRRG